MARLDDAVEVLKDCRKRLDEHVAECPICTKYKWCGPGKKLRLRLTAQENDVRIILRRVDYRNGNRSNPS